MTTTTRNAGHPNPVDHSIEGATFASASRLAWTHYTHSKCKLSLLIRFFYNAFRDLIVLLQDHFVPHHFDKA
jgi:hypothetical protein